MDDGLRSQLDEWLEATADRYEVRQTLKESASGVTQVVYRRATGTGGATVGPFVRKIFFGDAGLGGAYERIMTAQTKGIRPVHLPFVYDVERTDTSLEVVMEYVHGETLRELVDRCGPGIGVAQRIVPGLCEATAELHESLGEPLIHRDIKPSNVMVARDRVVLIDLGIARSWRADAQHDTMHYGTPGYAPPEQFGYGQTSVCSDVYALGMTIAYCFTAEEPTVELRERGFKDERIPEAVRPVLVRATQFDPAARHVSARALAADLEHALTGLGNARLSPGGSRNADVNPSRSAEPPQRMRFARLGMVWNALLVLVWGLLVLASFAGTIRPGEGLTIATYPMWFRALGFLSIVVLPAGSIAYLALDKRRLRRYPLFAGRTLLQEFLVCLALIFVIITITLIVYITIVDPPS